MYDYQCMVIWACNQVWWTWEVEDIFRKVKRGDQRAMKNYTKKLHSQVDALVVQVGVCLRGVVKLELIIMTYRTVPDSKGQALVWSGCTNAHIQVTLFCTSFGCSVVMVTSYC